MKWSALFRAPKLQLLSQEKSLLGTISRRTIVIPYCSSKRKNSTQENAPHAVLFLHGRRKKQKFDWIKFIIKEICSETNTHTALGWQVTFWLWQPGEMDRRKREEKGATKYWDFHNSANLQWGHQLITDSADWDKIGKMSPGTCWASGVCVCLCVLLCWQAVKLICLDVWGRVCDLTCWQLGIQVYSKSRRRRRIVFVLACWDQFDVICLFYLEFSESV